MSCILDELLSGTVFLEFYILTSSNTCLRSLISSVSIDPHLGYLF